MDKTLVHEWIQDQKCPYCGAERIELSYGKASIFIDLHCSNMANRRHVLPVCCDQYRKSGFSS
jgi:hypothetical protein